jgi:hypothetical protein
MFVAGFGGFTVPVRSLGGTVSLVCSGRLRRDAFRCTLVSLLEVLNPCYHISDLLFQGLPP